MTNKARDNGWGDSDDDASDNKSDAKMEGEGCDADLNDEGREGLTDIARDNGW